MKKKAISLVLIGLFLNVGLIGLAKAGEEADFNTTLSYYQSDILEIINEQSNNRNPAGMAKMRQEFLALATVKKLDEISKQLTKISKALESKAETPKTT